MEWILLVQTRNVGLVTNIPTAEYLSARQVLGNLEIVEVLWQVGIDRLAALVKNSNYLENSLITLGLIIRVKSYTHSMS